jgi:hypothetical protein
VGDKPFELVRVDDLARHLRTTMARAGDVFAASMRSQLSHIVSWFLRMRLAGAAYIHPGMAKMARWGQCSERQARENFSRLRQWGVVEVVAYPKGGRRASRFVVHFSAIKMLLVEMGANPSTALCDKFRNAENPALKPEFGGVRNPAVLPAFTSAGIPADGGASGRLEADVVGGRDA